MRLSDGLWFLATTEAQSVILLFVAVKGSPSLKRKQLEKHALKKKYYRIESVSTTKWK